MSIDLRTTQPEKEILTIESWVQPMLLRQSLPQDMLSRDPDLRERCAALAIVEKAERIRMLNCMTMAMISFPWCKGVRDFERRLCQGPRKLFQPLEWAEVVGEGA